MPLSDQPGLHERSLMATTSILSSRFPFMLTFHPLPSSRSDTFSSYLRSILRISHHYYFVIRSPLDLLRHLQDLCSINIAFVSLPQKVNMRDTPNFSHLDTHAFYMIKEMKISVIYTQSARPLFAPCLFYLKRYRGFLSLSKARILVAKATCIDPATINKALNNIIKVE